MTGDPTSFHESQSATTTTWLSGQRVSVLGKLGGMTRKELVALLREHDGQVVSIEQQPDLVVLGAEESPISIDSLLDNKSDLVAAAHDAEVLTETELWERLGYVPAEGAVRKLYTPAMLADLLDVPINVIRRWHRRGLIAPVREVHRLPYFDFQEIAVAQHLAKLLAAGASAAAIEKKLAELTRWLPHVERPLAQLSVIVAGRDLLLRDGEGLVDSSGQRRFDFDAANDPNDDTDTAEAAYEDDDATDTAIFAFPERQSPTPTLTLGELLHRAADLEDEGRLDEAIDTYRAALAVGGPNAEINFLIAELLYRVGDITAARERYYTALELDEDYVEARANLGCVLAETGQLDLAVAAFEGTLARHDGYPDVHYHMARTLDEMGDPESADEHWRTFLQLSPESPWAEEARDRLGLDMQFPLPSAIDSGLDTALDTVSGSEIHSNHSNPPPNPSTTTH